MKLRLCFMGLVAGLLGTFQTPAVAQRGFSQLFSNGAAILTTGDTLRGRFEVYHGTDVIRVTEPDRTVKTFSASAVRIFAVRGERLRTSSYLPPVPASAPNRRTGLSENGQYGYSNSSSGLYQPRTFMRLPIDTTRIRLFRCYLWDRDAHYGGYRSPAFFEQLTNGPVLLLRRQRLRNYALFNVGSTSWQYPITTDRFFLVMPDGKLVTLRRPRKDLLAAFGADAEAIQKYAKQHQLNFFSTQHIAVLVTYANSLKTGTASPSSQR